MENVPLCFCEDIDNLIIMDEVHNAENGEISDHELNLEYEEEYYEFDQEFVESEEDEGSQDPESFYYNDDYYNDYHYSRWWSSESIIFYQELHQSSEFATFLSSRREQLLLFPHTEVIESTDQDQQVPDND